MNRGPDGLAHDIDIGDCELAGIHSFPDGAAKRVEATETGRHRAVVVRSPVEFLGIGSIEDDQIVLWVVQAETDVAEQAAPETGEGVGFGLVDHFELSGEFAERLFANGGQDADLVPEVEIDRRRGVFDAVGNLADGEVGVALVDDQVGGSVENSLAEGQFFAGAAFSDAHKTYTVNLPYGVQRRNPNHFGSGCVYYTETMLRVVAGILYCVVPTLLWGQGFGGIFEKAPPEIEKALKDRIDLFYKAHLEQNWGKALQTVHPESANAFIGADKMQFRSYKVVAINWDENYTVAKAVIDFDTEFFFPGFGKRDVHVPLTSVWKLQDSQWYWYAVPFNAQTGKNSPFGPMFRDSKPGEQTDIGKMMTSGPTIADLRSRVVADRSEVTLQSDVPSEATVRIVSKFEGPVHLKLDVDELPCLSAKLDKPVLQVGETATVTFSCKPETRVKKPDGRATITVEEIAKVMTVQINFAYPTKQP